VVNFGLSDSILAVLCSVGQPSTRDSSPKEMSPPGIDFRKKSILVVGATGAQGIAVIDSLLAPTEDGSPSPYAIRALTRDPSSRRAKELAAKGVECVKGSFDDFATVEVALCGVYGAWVNTDGFTVGEQKEIYAGMRIFELAKQNGNVRHYVWSSLDYGFKKGNYDPAYRCEHYDGKGRVAEWMKAQPSSQHNDAEVGMSWSIITSAPYMEMLSNLMFGPVNRRPDGTFVFATPIGNGHIPMIALSDLGFFARYTFDHRVETSGRELEIASDWVDWGYLTETFSTTVRQKAIIVHQSMDEWFGNFEGVDRPVANELGDYAEGMTTWKENFSGWWTLFRDDLITRDWEWIRSVNPKGHTLKSWMRENRYTGQLRRDVLKNTEDGKTITPRREKLSKL